jgi:hypothetical protein
VLVKAGGLTRDTVLTVFEGTCAAITGDVQLSTTTGGTDPDPNGYTVTVDGQLVLACGWWDYGCEPGAPLMLEPNGLQFFFQVQPGEHTYQLGDVAPNCTVLNGNSRTVSVTAGEEATLVLFGIICADVP